MPVPAAPDDDRRARFRSGFVAGLPYAVVGVVVSMSFGVVAHDVGFPVLAIIVMSVVVFAGSAQFTALTILASGGGAVPAIVAASLVNSRFLPMGVAMGPSFPGRAAWRATQGQAIVDTSWAMANRGDGTYDRWFLFGSTLPQYVTWVGGTVLGALTGDLLGDTDRFGLDAVYPMFFLALLIGEIKSRRAAGVALAGAAVALSLVQVAPAGAPVLAASLVALWGLRTRRADQ